MPKCSSEFFQNRFIYTVIGTTSLLRIYCSQAPLSYQEYASFYATHWYNIASAHILLASTTILSRVCLFLRYSLMTLLPTAKASYAP
jgi:hypothetical protein